MRVCVVCLVADTDAVARHMTHKHTNKRRLHWLPDTRHIHAQTNSVSVFVCVFMCRVSGYSVCISYQTRHINTQTNSVCVFVCLCVVYLVADTDGVCLCVYVSCLVADTDGREQRVRLVRSKSSSSSLSTLADSRETSGEVVHIDCSTWGHRGRTPAKFGQLL